MLTSNDPRWPPPNMVRKVQSNCKKNEFYVHATTFSGMFSWMALMCFTSTKGLESWRIELVSCSYRCVSSLPCLLSRHPPRGRGSSNEENQGGGGFPQRRRPDADRQREGGRRLGLSVIEVRVLCIGSTYVATYKMFRYSLIPATFLPQINVHNESMIMYKGAQNGMQTY